MSHVHVRRFLRTLEGWRADEWDDYVENPGAMSGTVADLSPETPDEPDGLVDVSGRPIPRRPAPRRRMGFLPPEECMD